MKKPCCIGFTYYLDRNRSGDGSYAHMSKNNGADRVSSIRREIMAIQLVRDQHFALNCFDWHVAGGRMQRTLSAGRKFVVVQK
jgi:hypothetical protein